MDTARIAELLEPFLSAPVPAEGAPSSRTLRGWETPKRIRRESAVESASDRFESALSVAKARTINDALYQHISTYIDLLLRWNARINLTAIRDPEQIVTRHFGESLFAARILFPTSVYVGTAAPGCPAEQSSALTGSPDSAAERRKNAAHGASRGSSAREEDAAPEGRKRTDEGEQQDAASVQHNNEPPTTNGCTVADIGSGAGFPGIPLKLWAPQISLTLIESNHKKAAFLREITRALTLTNIDIQNARAETLPEQSFDLVTLRAVERFEKILPTAARLLAPSGTLALLIGTSQLPEAQALPELLWSAPIPIPQSKSRILAIARHDANN